MSVSSTNADLNTAPPAVSFFTALYYWLKLGFISFGGPAGQISMMHQELVERRRWISEHRFLHALNYCMLLPGPEAQQLATYVGWLMHGVWGGIAAGVLFVLPSLFILVALTWVYLVYGNIIAVAGILYGIKPAVTAIVVFAAFRIGSRALKSGALWMLAAAAFIAIFVFNVPFPYIVLIAGVIGVIGGRIAPDKFKTGGGHGSSGKSYGPALIDDRSGVAEHARFRWTSAIRFAAIGIGLWASVLLFLTLRFGWDRTLTQMGWFFTKAALLTFGGAYAVLPYVFQGGVEHYHWLTAQQMIDGLALGETTPGPLIMIVSFVGFVGAWTQQVFGAGHAFAAGVAGAGVAAFFTFLPSFVFIFLGAPLVEATRNDLKFTAPLTAITAAVVGVILNLAVFFAYHVLWPQGFVTAGALDTLKLVHGFAWPEAAIGVIAFVALFRLKWGIIPVIGLSAVLGLGYFLIAV